MRLNRKYSFRELFTGGTLSKYKIIPNCQTPKVEEIKDVQGFIATHKKELLEFLDFASSTFGAGVSANQVSVNGQTLMWKVFAINGLADMNDIVWPQDNVGWHLVINPEITEYIGEKKIEFEGCMSFSCNTLEVERSPKIKVSYYTIDGKKVENKIIEGFKAQIWQHETNHLNGVVEKKLPKTGLEKTVCKSASFLFPLPPVQAIKAE